MSQEIQIVNPTLPLQPALTPQALAYSGGSETTPLRKVHQLLRGRYLLAGILAAIGAACGTAAGIMLPKPAWESIGVVQVHPVLHGSNVVDPVAPLYQNMINNCIVRMHTESVIKKAMQSADWRRVRPYAGEFPPADQVAEFSKNLTLKTIPFDPEMIQVTYDDGRKDGKDAAPVAVKSIIEAYLEVWGSRDFEKEDQKIKLLTNERNDLNRAITADEEIIAGISKDAGDRYTEAALSAHEQYKMTLERSLEDAKAMLKAAEHDRDLHSKGLANTAGVTAEEIARVDPQILKLLTDRNDAQIKLQLLENQYLPGWPAVTAQKKLLAAQEQYIANAVKRFNESYFIERRADGSGGAAVSKDLSKLNAAVQSLEEERQKETKLMADISSRNAKMAPLKDDLANKKLRVEKINESIDGLNFEKAMGGTFTVIDPGGAAVPASDRRPVFAALGFLGGALLPIGFLLLIGLANPRYRFSDETGSDMNGLNLLGILPDLPDRLSDPEQASIAAHCVHQIRTMLQISGAPDERRVFAITSAAPGDGKTSLTLALGLSYAACGAHTLLIDCDLIGAGLTARMNVHSPGGVLEAIANRSLLDYVRGTDVADVSILPVGTSQSLHASTLSPAALRRLIDEARKQFDTILIDTGPILGSIEASLVCAAADAVILTVARGQQRPLVEKAISRLVGIGAKVAGVVFNRAQPNDFDRTISGASSVRSAASGSEHNGHDQPRYGALGRAVQSSKNSDINEG
jgi:polysaccharide biosynthesis transport protein